MQRLSEETFSNLGFKAHDKILNLQILVDSLFESAKQLRLCMCSFLKKWSQKYPLPVERYTSLNP